MDQNYAFLLLIHVRRHEPKTYLSSYVYGVVTCMRRGEKGIYLTRMTSISCGSAGHVEFPSKARGPLKKTEVEPTLLCWFFYFWWGAGKVGPTSNPSVPPNTDDWSIVKVVLFVCLCCVICQSSSQPTTATALSFLSFLFFFFFFIIFKKLQGQYGQRKEENDIIHLFKIILLFRFILCLIGRWRIIDDANDDFFLT